MHHIYVGAFEGKNHPSMATITGREPNKNNELVINPPQNVPPEPKKPQVTPQPPQPNPVQPQAWTDPNTGGPSRRQALLHAAETRANFGREPSSGMSTPSIPSNFFGSDPNSGMSTPLYHSARQHMHTPLSPMRSPINPRQRGNARRLSMGDTSTPPFLPLTYNHSGTNSGVSSGTNSGVSSGAQTPINVMDPINLDMRLRVLQEKRDHEAQQDERMARDKHLIPGENIREGHQFKR